MKIAFAVGVPSQTTDELARVSRLAEEAGFEMMMTGDSPALCIELYVALTLIAQNTERCKVASFVTNPQSRHPVVTASGISSINQLSGGRAMLGIATGDSGVFNLGMKSSSLAKLETYITTLRELWRNSEATYNDATVRLMWSPTPIPIYISAGGPRSLRLAGRVADGVFIETGLLPEVVEDSLTHVEAGARESGRRLEDIDVWWYAKGNIAPSVDEAAYEIRSGLASSANHTFRFTLDGKFVPPELRDKIETLKSNYIFHQHVQPGEHIRNAQLVDELGLREYFSDRFAILGTTEEWKRRIEGLTKLGIRKIALAAVMPDKDAFLTAMGRDVIPAFSA